MLDNKITKRINIMYTHMLILFLLTAYLLITDGECIIRIITSKPCLGCGTIRAWKSFIRGNFSLAIAYHPLFLIAPLTILLPIHIRLLFKSKKAKNVSSILTLLPIAVLYLVVFIVRIINGNIAIVM